MKIVETAELAPTCHAGCKLVETAEIARPVTTSAWWRRRKSRRPATEMFGRSLPWPGAWCPTLGHFRQGWGFS